MNARDSFDGIVLLDHALGAVIELLAVVLGPPVVQVSILVELAALVIETVGEFVADGRSHVAIIGRFVFLVAEERRLQDSGGEVDVVLLGIVVGIDGGRRNLPFALIDGLADFCQVAGEFEFAGPLLIAQRFATHDF